MCRHLAYLGAPRPLAGLLLDPPHGLYEQSYAPRRQRHGTVNADGFGIGWYPEPPPEAEANGGPEPARYRRAVPVWSDPNLSDLARVLRSGCVLAAVRDATPGTAYDEAAVAPYRAGPWLFSHNGAVSDWQLLPRDAGLGLSAEELLRLEARCDAAVLWAAVHARLAAGEPPGAALSAVVRQVAAVRPQARLNLLLTDGRSIHATRWGDTLWYRYDAYGLIVASEPDSATGPAAREGAQEWLEVPECSLLTADRASVRTEPLAQPVQAAAQPSPAAPPSGVRLATTERTPAP
ncbi:ergothioneine biosynthesis protein EgtC [Streptomyces sp. ODS28]|uniref:ergothioneine biosynthesis protein EgtC n=1 Tax=Streptomyces sp. ODS28 TaxID=3136688 RepID=UPI0031E8C751